MVTVTRELAERIAALAELLTSDDSSDAQLRQLSALALELVPRSAAVGLVVAGDNSWVFSASEPIIAGLHRSQIDGGNGPIAEALRFGEARRVDDASAADRWPDVCSAMTKEGLLSCLVLPLRTDRDPGGVLAIYGREQGCFAGTGHDLALLFAAQGGVALRNATLYRNCRRLVDNLRVALESRAVIEQAKGILVAEYGYSPDIAFKRLSALSQNTNRKVKDIAADLVAGKINGGQLGEETRALSP
jgi:GAF domain-containing protein